jgi:hypothetical protein
MLDSVYDDTLQEKRTLAIRPKAPFKSVFQVATTGEDSSAVWILSWDSRGLSTSRS